MPAPPMNDTPETILNSQSLALFLEKCFEDKKVPEDLLLADDKLIYAFIDMIVEYYDNLKGNLWTPNSIYHYVIRSWDQPVTEMTAVLETNRMVPSSVDANEWSDTVQEWHDHMLVHELGLGTEHYEVILSQSRPSGEKGYKSILVVKSPLVLDPAEKNLPEADPPQG